LPAPRSAPASDAAALLPALRDLFREHGVDRLPTEAAVAALGARLGRPITPHWLARALKPHGVAPRQFRLQGRQRWGYCLRDFAESRNAALPGEGLGAGPLAESRDAEIHAGGDARDPAAEWSWRIAAVAAARW
jgi:hypothetical protein